MNLLPGLVYSRTMFHCPRFTAHLPYAIVLARPQEVERKSYATDRIYLQRITKPDAKALLAFATKSPSRQS